MSVREAGWGPKSRGVWRHWKSRGRALTTGSRPREAFAVHAALHDLASISFLSFFCFLFLLPLYPFSHSLLLIPPFHCSYQFSPFHFLREWTLHNSSTCWPWCKHGLLFYRSAMSPFSFYHSNSGNMPAELTENNWQNWTLHQSTVG